MHTHLKHIAKFVAAGTLCYLFAAPASAGSTRTMQVDLTGRAMEKAHPAARAAAERNRSSGRAIRLEGELRSSGRGIYVGRKLIEITHETAIYPRMRADRMPDPDSFDGRRVTVFGRETADGIEASVLVMQGASNAGSHVAPKKSPYAIEVTSTTGYLRDDVPQ